MTDWLNAFRNRFPDAMTFVKTAKTPISASFDSFDNCHDDQHGRCHALHEQIAIMVVDGGVRLERALLVALMGLTEAPQTVSASTWRTMIDQLLIGPEDPENTT